MMDPERLQRDFNAAICLSDINFNSPEHHHSSQDGSFMQDEGDMRLILDFDPGGGARRSTTVGKTVPTVPYDWEYDANMGHQTTDGLPFQPMSVLTESWIRRGRAKWATDYDANIAELDFDNVNTDAILGLPSRPPTNTNNTADSCYMKGSLELSSGESLFSSAAPPTDDDIAQRVEQGFGGDAMLSTDSLSASAFDPEILRAVCKTKKHDYVLTFGAGETNMIDSSIMTTSSMTRSGAALPPMQLQTQNYRQHNNNNGNTFTTWGRIKRSYDATDFAENDDDQCPKSNSLPNLMTNGRSPTGAGEGLTECIPIFDLSASVHSSQHFKRDLGSEFSDNCNQQPISLLKAFKSRRSGLESITEDDHNNRDESRAGSSGYHTGENHLDAMQRNAVQVDDYEYSEVYVGGGHYMDVNHNEIGFVPPSTAGIQHIVSEKTTPVNGASPISPNHPTTPTNEHSPRDRWANLQHPSVAKIAPTKPPRTFAALLGRTEEHNQPNEEIDPSTPRTNAALLAENKSDISTEAAPEQMVIGAPELEFLKLPHDIPAFLASTAPFPLNFLTSENPTIEQLEGQLSAKLQHHNQPVGASDPALPLLADQPAGIQRSSPLFAALTNPNFLLAANNDEAKCQRLLVDEVPNPPSLLTPSSSSAALAAQTAVASAVLHEQEERFNIGLPDFATVWSHKSMGSNIPVNQQQQPGSSTSDNNAMTRDRDSGLGSSGPSHIQDWESLAVLLPKNVAQACSFFKANSQLLAQSINRCDGSNVEANSIERPTSSRRYRSEPRHHSNMGRRRSRFEDIHEEGCICPCAGPSRHVTACCHQAQPCLQHTVHHHHSRHAPQPAFLHCCAGLVNTVAHCPCQQCPSASMPCYPTAAIDCHQPWCQGPGNSRYSTGRRLSNLCKWRHRQQHHKQDGMSESEDFSSDEAAAGYRRAVSFVDRRPRRLSLAESTMTDDSCASAEYDSGNEGGPNCGLRVTSEYQLREREHGVQPPQFYSFRHIGRSVTSASTTDSVRPCATCYGLRSPTSVHPPAWALPPSAKHIVCDCQTSDIIEERNLEKRRWRKRRPFDIHPEELSVRNTPIYQQKKELVENAVKSCDELLSAYAALKNAQTASVQEALSRTIGRHVINSLCPSMEKLLVDGLKSDITAWQVVQASTGLGPATKPVYELVSDLTKLYDNDLFAKQKDRVADFMQGLLRLRALDCWLSYVAIKDNLLEQYYEEAGFLRRADSAYRSLFDRLIGAVQPLSMFPFQDQLHDPCRPPKAASVTETGTNCNNTLQTQVPSVAVTPPGDDDDDDEKYPASPVMPTKIPGDSRVPKSSSIPARLLNQVGRRQPKSHSVDTGLSRMAKLDGASNGARSRRPSRIPVPMKESVPAELRKSLSNTKSATPVDENSRFVCAIGDVKAKREQRGFLDLRKGERLEVVQVIGGQLRCKRLETSSDRVHSGLVDRKNITYITFV